MLILNIRPRLNILILFFFNIKDYSEPQSPTSPTSSNRSFALSVNSIPIVRSDKHVVLTSTSPARPKMASMQAKLDHTKIDTSLYQQVCHVKASFINDVPDVPRLKILPFMPYNFLPLKSS